MASFKEAWLITAHNEGGYANVKNDRGGETYMGIARNFFPKWAGWAIVDKHKPLKHNAFIKDEKLHSLVESFYEENFWNPINANKIADQDLANQAFDMAVNAGVGAAKNLLKQSGI